MNSTSSIDTEAFIVGAGFSGSASGAGGSGFWFPFFGGGFPLEAFFGGISRRCVSLSLTVCVCVSLSKMKVMKLTEARSLFLGGFSFLSLIMSSHASINNKSLQLKAFRGTFVAWTYVPLCGRISHTSPNHLTAVHWPCNIGGGNVGVPLLPLQGRTSYEDVYSGRGFAKQDFILTHQSQHIFHR